MCTERPKPRLDYWGSKYSEPQSAIEHATSTSRQNCVQIQYLNPSRLNVCVCVCVVCVCIYMYMCVLCVYVVCVHVCVCGVCVCVVCACGCMCVHLCMSVCGYLCVCICVSVRSWWRQRLHFQSRRTPRYTHGFSWSAGFPQPLDQTFSNIII